MHPTCVWNLPKVHMHAPCVCVCVCVCVWMHNVCTCEMSTPELETSAAPARATCVCYRKGTRIHVCVCVCVLHADVATDVVGKYCYYLDMPLEKRRVPLLVDVTLMGRNKIIKLHSALFVEVR